MTFLNFCDTSGKAKYAAEDTGDLRDRAGKDHFTGTGDDGNGRHPCQKPHAAADNDVVPYGNYIHGAYPAGWSIMALRLMSVISGGAGVLFFAYRRFCAFVIPKSYALTG